MNRPGGVRTLGAILRDGEGLDLVEACLAIAAEEYPGVDMRQYASWLERQCDDVACRTCNLEEANARLEALHGIFFGEMQFSGNEENYYDPRNSYLNDVIELRTGLPITLSVLYLEFARAAGFAAWGVALPGHFVVRLGDWEPSAFIDVFGGGALLTEEGCEARMQESTGLEITLSPEMLRPASPRSIVQRVLTNLEFVYCRYRDWLRALRAAEQILLLQPEDINQLLLTSALHQRLGHEDLATEAMERCRRLASERGLTIDLDSPDLFV